MIVNSRQGTYGLCMPRWRRSLPQDMGRLQAAAPIWNDVHCQSICVREAAGCSHCCGECSIYRFVVVERQNVNTLYV